MTTPELDRYYKELEEIFRSHSMRGVACRCIGGEKEHAVATLQNFADKVKEETLKAFENNFLFSSSKESVTIGFIKACINSMK